MRCCKKAATGPARRRALLGALSWLAGLWGGPLSATPSTASTASIRQRPLVLPRDHGAHPDVRIEWWYVTGWAGRFEAPTHGFQLTFFRHRTRLAHDIDSRLAPRQLLLAHAAVTDLGAALHVHTERMARWSGHEDSASRAIAADTDLRLQGWFLKREPVNGSGLVASLYRTGIDDATLSLDLSMSATQAVLLQGDAGYSRKGPDEQQASHYITEPQLQVQGRLRVRQGPWVTVQGRAWLDHEWSQELLHPQAVGWDWIGMNLQDGSALTAFRLRKADGSTLWAGGSHRPAGVEGAEGPLPRVFRPDEVEMRAGRTWRSPSSRAEYPVEWTLRSPAGLHRVRTLLDAQELDGRRGTGTVYWEGLSELLDQAGQRVGLGYLEMTGYAGRLRL